MVRFAHRQPAPAVRLLKYTWLASLAGSNDLEGSAIQYCGRKLKISEKSETKNPDIRIVEILNTTLEIIHAKFHESRVNIVAVK